MFQAPVDIMTAGTFDSVRDLALDENRWLLVNIQRESEFQSHVLNRDFWNDETAKNLIACNFIFWQQQDISFEGEKFISRYKVSAARVHWCGQRLTVYRSIGDHVSIGLHR